jgi:hypothetical protein
MDGYKLRRYGRLVIFAPSSHLPETRRAAKVPFNKLIGAFEMYQASLELAVDDSAVYCSSWIHKSHRMDFPLHPIFLEDQRKVVTIEGTSGKKQDTAHSLDFHFPRVNRVLCTGVGVVIVYLQCVGGTWLKCIK